MKLDRSPLCTLSSPPCSCCFSATMVAFSLAKCLTSCEQDSIIVRIVLPSSDNAIDINGIELDKVAAPPCLVGGNQGRAAAAESIENDAAAFRHILDGIGNHGDRIPSRVE